MKRVLIIDDAATVRAYHRQLLEREGFTVDEAINGIEALEKTLSQPYDLYLVDVNMPKMDGYTFLRELRNQKDIPQSPAVMISTESENKDRLAALEAGANFYLVKPASPETLVKLVRLLTGEAHP